MYQDKAVRLLKAANRINHLDKTHLQGIRVKLNQRRRMQIQWKVHLKRLKNLGLGNMAQIKLVCLEGLKTCLEELRMKHLKLAKQNLRS